MNNKEGYIFWRVAYSFISDQGYRVIQLFENQKELWLEKLENKKAPIIRILLHDLNWSNAMQRDIEFTASNGERVRKQIGKRELNVLNIYVSQFPPVDEYEYRLAKPFVFPQENKTTVTSIILASGKLESGFRNISENLSSEIHFEFQDDYSEQEVDELKKSALNLNVKKVKAEQEILFNGKPLLTYVFIVIQLVVFLWMEIHGGSTNTSTLIKYGAKVNALIYQGEWWRLITPIFLHSGFLHLVMNTLALYFLGLTVERIFGNIRFLFIYLFAGVTGFISSFLFSPIVSVGASGAIYGCFGALLYFGTIYPKLFSRKIGLNLIVVLGINLVFSFTSSGIDNYGHLGGLAGGFLAAGMMHFPKNKKWVLQLLFFFLSVTIVGGSLFYGYHSTSSTVYEDSVVMLAQEYVNKGNYKDAYKVLKDFEQKTSNPTEKTYLILGFVEYKQNLLSDAKTHLHKAIEYDSKLSTAYYYLAIINFNENNFKQAKQNAEKAVKLNPSDQDFSKLLNYINQTQSTGKEG